MGVIEEINKELFLWAHKSQKVTRKWSNIIYKFGKTYVPIQQYFAKQSIDISAVCIRYIQNEDKPCKMSMQYFAGKLLLINKISL